MVGQVLVEFSRELAPLAAGELCRHAVIGFALEGLDFLLALSDQSHGHALHSSCRESRHDLAPEHGREFKAHDAVKHATCLLSVDQVQVDVARMLDGIEDSRLGNLMEDDAARVVGRQSQHLEQMPSNGFSLAVFITCEPHEVGLSSLILEFLDMLLLVFGNFVERFEAVLHVNAEILLVQVTDMSETRHHFIFITQEFLNGLCLGRGLDDY